MLQAKDFHLLRGYSEGMAVAQKLWQTSDIALVEQLVAMETQMRRDYSAMLDLLSELDNRCAATKLGYSNTAALLVHALRIARAEARHRLSQAEDLHAVTTPTGSTVEAVMPRTAEALAEGSVGAGHVEVIQKTLRSMKHLQPEQLDLAEELMIERAVEDDPTALARYGNRWVRDIVDPDGTPPAFEEPARPERELKRHIRGDGSMEFKGRLDPQNAALFEALLKPFDKRHNEAQEGPDTRGYAERGGDAFADVLQMAANCPDLPTQNGLKTEVAFTISMDALQQALADTVLPTGDLTAREARRLACDAHVLPVVMGGESQPLDVAVPAYVAPAHIRRGLVLRDRGCTFPSCDRPASTCHGHHIKSWLTGGPTSLKNMILLCGHHHRLIHRSDWQIQLTGNIPWFIPPPYIDPARKPRRNVLRR